MNSRAAAAVIVLALALAGCGTRGALRPEPGQSLPVAPYGRLDRPTAEELLTRPVQAAPGRSIELRRRSEEREDDPFDLPPDEPGARRRNGEPVIAPDTPARECPPLAEQGSTARLASCPRSSPATSAAG